jgi:hypothetical protein
VAFTVPDHGIVIENPGPGNLDVRIRSFADNFPAAPLGSVEPHQAALLAIPRRPVIVWHAQVTVPAQARVCAR